MLPAPPPAWTAPVQPVVVTQSFQLDRSRPFAAGAHRGLDLRARAGQAVAAPCAGTVTFRGAVAGGPPVVTIRCGDGWKATVGGVVAGAPNGASVSAGTRLGVARGRRVELSARDIGGGYRDPRPLLRAGPPGGAPVPASRAPRRPPRPARLPSTAFATAPPAAPASARDSGAVDRAAAALPVAAGTLAALLGLAFAIRRARRPRAAPEPCLATDARPGVAAPIR